MGEIGRLLQQLQRKKVAMALSFLLFTSTCCSPFTYFFFLETSAILWLCKALNSHTLCALDNTALGTESLSLSWSAYVKARGHLSGNPHALTMGQRLSKSAQSGVCQPFCPWWRNNSLCDAPGAHNMSHSYLWFRKPWMYRKYNAALIYFTEKPCSVRVGIVVA